jgi:hypothetical protein
MTVTEMPQIERPLSEQYRIVAKQFAEAYGRATFMENTRSGELAKMIKKRMDEANEKITRATAEMDVKASEDWYDFNERLALAKEKVEILRSQKKYIEMQAWERTNADANKRKEMGMG